jgi:hypothetical protein
MSQATNGTAKAGSEYVPSNFRIISIRTAKRMLHIEDCLHIGRVRFDAWAYEKGNGSTAHVDAYLTPDDARLIASEFIQGRIELPIERSGGGVVKGNVIARTFKMEAATGTDYPIRVTVGNAPGSRQPSGLITINQGATPVRVQVLISATEARKLGLAIREHLQAWAAATYTARLSAGTYHPTQAEPGDIIPEQSGADVIDEQVLADDDNPTPDDQGTQPDTTETQPPEVIVTYLDGKPVSDNEAEIAAFATYCHIVGNKPDSLPSLRSWAKRTGYKFNGTKLDAAVMGAAISAQVPASDAGKDAKAKPANRLPAALYYGSGKPVPMDNLDEVDTFKAYVETKHIFPPNPENLCSWAKATGYRPNRT